MSAREAHLMLQRLAGDPSQRQWLIHGSGIAGDPAYVPWLIELMTEPETARVAGEAFALIAGIDPTSTTDLSGPDPDRSRGWWDANRSRFRAGERCFLGAPVTREHCIDVLKNGCQPQRALAAHHLCLLAPGTPLFNTNAPASRQQRLLAEMK
jgi:hypothetical protein